MSARRFKCRKRAKKGEQLKFETILAWDAEDAATTYAEEWALEDGDEVVVDGVGRFRVTTMVDYFVSLVS